MTIRIALDAMGGDHSAVPNIQGAYWAIERSHKAGNKLKVFLCGKKDVILDSVAAASADEKIPWEFRVDKPNFERCLNEGLIEIVDCASVVEMGESPALAIRKKRDSSMAEGFKLVKENKADAMISAGNSGAIMAFGIATLGRIAGVRRPAILCHFPSKTGVTAVLDGGANVDCTVEQLTQFAEMGDVYFQSVFEKETPRVSLLNIGVEEGKGNEVVKATHKILKEKLGSHYIGFIEGRDIMMGKTDVVVCDGFVGNVVLKTAEGVVQVVKETLKESFSKNPIWGLGAWLAKGGFISMKSKLDYREYGAAPLIGLNGLGLVAHGSSDGKAISSAIRIAELYAKNDLMKKLRSAFETTPLEEKGNQSQPVGGN